MTTLSAANGFNASSSLGQWLADGLAGLPLPSFIPELPPVILNAGDIQAQIPCFAVYFIPVGLSFPFVGKVVGAAQRGGQSLDIMEVSLYVTKEDVNYVALQRVMGDMVKTLVAGSPSVNVLDYWTDPFSPPATEYRLNLGEVTEITPEPDTDNPSIVRQRILIEYSYTYRAGV